MFTSSGKITFLESNNDSFNSRQKSVFDELDKIEKSRPSNRYSEEEYFESEHHCKKAKVGCSKTDFGQFVGEESIFKTPPAPAPKKKEWISKMPDYQVNPHKWTKYTLSDVSDLSERGNTAAAMAFLREQGSVADPIKSSRVKIAPKFTISTQKIQLSEEKAKPPPEHPLFQGTKRIMPEYVVGQKKSKKVSEKVKPAEVSTNQVKLDHLFDNEDE